MKKYESTVNDILSACKIGALSWEEVARKALKGLADVWNDELSELFDLDELEAKNDKNLEERLSRLERQLGIKNEALPRRLGKLEPEAMIKDFTAICKSCNLTDVKVKGSKASCTFDIAKFSRRIQKRMDMSYHSALKSLAGTECRLDLDANTEKLDLVIGRKKEPVTLDEFTHIKKEDRNHILSFIGDAIERYLDSTNRK